MPREKIAEALGAVKAIGDEKHRANALGLLAPRLAPEELAEALDAATMIGDEGLRTHALELLAPHLAATSAPIRQATGRLDRGLPGLSTSGSALKEHERDDRDDEIAPLKSKVGEITMDNELLYAKIEALEDKRPLARRRWSR